MTAGSSNGEGRGGGEPIEHGDVNRNSSVTVSINHWPIDKVPSQWGVVVLMEEYRHVSGIWVMTARDSSGEGQGVANQSIAGISMQMQTQQSKLITG